MKKTKYIFLLLISILIVSCSSEDDKLEPSGEDLFPPMESSAIDEQLKLMFTDYNTRVEYRYIKNYLPSDWYYITPIKEELVIPMSQLILDMWVHPLEEGSSKEFVGKTFPKMLIFVGSPAYQLNGSRVLGQAEGGTLIRFTETNDFDKSNTAWVNGIMHTAFHEYGHIIHQRFGFPNEYLAVTPNSYVKNGWMAVKDQEALRKGMVSPYGTSSPQEDFVELFSTYVIASEKELQNYFVDVEKPTPDQAIDNEGRAILRQKLSIQKKYMLNAGIDMDTVRVKYQSLLPKEKS